MRCHTFCSFQGVSAFAALKAQDDALAVFEEDSAGISVLERAVCGGRIGGGYFARALAGRIPGGDSQRVVYLRSARSFLVFPGDDLLCNCFYAGAQTAFVKGIGDGAGSSLSAGRFVQRRVWNPGDGSAGYIGVLPVGWILPVLELCYACIDGLFHGLSAQPYEKPWANEQ